MIRALFWSWRPKDIYLDIIRLCFGKPKQFISHSNSLSVDNIHCMLFTGYEVRSILGKYLPEVSVIARSRRPRVVCETGETGDNYPGKISCSAIVDNLVLVSPRGIRTSSSHSPQRVIQASVVFELETWYKSIVLWLDNLQLRSKVVHYVLQFCFILVLSRQLLK